MKKHHKQRIEAAAGILEGLKRDLLEAEQRVKSVRSQVTDAEGELRDAKVAADAHLPRAAIVTYGWRSGKRESQIEVVVVKRTDKSVTVRVPGADSTRQFRLKGEKWRPYPSTKSSWASNWQALEFTKES